MDENKLEQQLEQLRTEVSEVKSLLQVRAEQCIIFIDNTNLSQTIKKIDVTGCYRLDYLKLTNFLARGRLLRQTRIYYSDFSDTAILTSDNKVKRQQREDFYNFLRYQGFYLKECSLIERDGICIEKGLDGTMIRDIERLSHDNRMETAILVTGDLDYQPVVVDTQREYGMRIEVAFFPSYTARDLLNRATRFIDLWAVKDLLARKTA
jgi:uncharacterized LabA/DUF88 family protein